MKRLLVLHIVYVSTCLSFGAPQYINYLMQITNNSNKPYKLYCDNFKWRHFTLTDLDQMYHTRLREQGEPIDAQDQIQKLQSAQRARIDILRFRQGKTDVQITRDSQIINLQHQIDALYEQCRPIINPRQTIKNLPCRLFSSRDYPTQRPTDWRLPKTFLVEQETQNPLVITVRDTNAQGNCGTNLIQIEASNSKGLASCCINNTAFSGLVELIINPDHTVTLQPLPQNAVTNVQYK